MIALRMAEIQEKTSKTARRKPFRDTIDLKSASGWKRWNLDVFNFTYNSGEYCDLEEYIRRNYTPPKDAHLDGRTSRYNEMDNSYRHPSEWQR